MSRRLLLTRSLGAAAIASIGLLVTALPAHANEFPKYPSATTESVCKPEGFQTLAGWKTHLANDAKSSGPVHFEVKIDAFTPYEYDLQPGDVLDETYGVADGLPSHITITADGSTLVDTSAARRCHDLIATITFTCSQPGNVPKLTYDMKNEMPVPITFTVHMPDGSTWSVDLAYADPYKPEASMFHFVKEDSPYDVSVTAEGKVLAQKSGVADCKAPPTTTSTTVPATHVGSGGQVTTTTVATPTSVAVAGAAQDAPPTTASPAATLPFTGSSSGPLAATGVTLIGIGVGAIAGLRRRPRRA